MLDYIKPGLQTNSNCIACAVTIYCPFQLIISIRLEGWKSDNLINIQLREIEDNLIYLSAIGNTCKITMSFSWLDVGVTGYAKIADK